MKTGVKILAWGVAYMSTLVLTLVLGYTITLFIMNHAPQENAKRVTETVYEVCEMSRAVINGDLELACGRAQLVSDTEYLCAVDNKRNTTCWVEDKR